MQCSAHSMQEGSHLALEIHEALVKKANALGPLPQSVARLNAILSDPYYEIHDVAETIKLDSILTGKLLRLANSPVYGSYQVGTVAQAIPRLGSGMIRSIAIAASVQPKKDLDLGCYETTPEGYWMHSVAALSFAEEVAAALPGTFDANFTTAALMHDFGKLILADYATADQKRRLSAQEPALSTYNKELLIFSVTHAEVGALVAQTWGLPDSLVKAIQYHHEPSLQDESMCYGLHLANQLALRLDVASDRYQKGSDARKATQIELQIDDELLEDVFKKGVNRFDSILDAYGLENHAS